MYTFLNKIKHIQADKIPVETWLLTSIIILINLVFWYEWNKKINRFCITQVNKIIKILQQCWNITNIIWFIINKFHDDHNNNRCLHIYNVITYKFVLILQGLKTVVTVNTIKLILIVHHSNLNGFTWLMQLHTLAGQKWVRRKPGNTTAPGFYYIYAIYSRQLCIHYHSPVNRFSPNLSNL